MCFLAAIMRSFSLLKEAMLPYVEVLITNLASKLVLVSKVKLVLNARDCCSKMLYPIKSFQYITSNLIANLEKRSKRNEYSRSSHKWTTLESRKGVHN